MTCVLTASVVSRVGAQQPIITQSATVTKITFGGVHHQQQQQAAHAPPVPSDEAELAGEPASGPAVDGEASVSDILKISMMEAQIDPGTEPVLVDSSGERPSLAQALEAKRAAAAVAAQHFAKERLEVIQVRLRFFPCCFIIAIAQLQFSGQCLCNAYFGSFHLTFVLIIPTPPQKKKRNRS